MKRTEWFLRTFPPIEDNGLLPGILERLEGTPARLYEKVSKIPAEVLNISSAVKWSVKKEIGHLIDLEPLWFERIGQIAASIPDMKVADLTNQKTHTTPHDEISIEGLLSDFKQARQRTMDKLFSLNDADLLNYSLHPRLKTPMRIIDLAYFVAEHDDHHLAQITILSKS